MRDLLGSHGFKYGTAACIARWKSREMLIEVTFDLSLRLGDEPQAGTVAEQSGAGADEEGARVPQGIEQARPCGELPEPHLAPRQMVRLGAGGRQEHRARGFSAGDERLAVVERLRGEFPGVVDTHECGTPAPVGFGKRFRELFIQRGDRSGGLGRRENRAQGAVKGGNA
jgi:hypothetical protein